MKLNADFKKRVIIFSEDIQWVDSPIPTVKRKMLERDGDEIARATSIVSYLPDSHFTEHTHGGGEEFFVLSGVFSDEYGDYPAGYYVRNPVGSKHAPYSQNGCTIFVKLWQMDSNDQQRICFNTSTCDWQPGQVSGLKVLTLHSFKNEHTALVKWEPGTFLNKHYHIGGEEIFVLDGVFEDELGQYPKGSWLRNPPGSAHSPFSRQGCLIYVKTGHLN